MKEVGTLKELGVKPGDVMECVSHTKHAGLLWTCYERHPDGHYDKPCIVYKTHWQEGYLKAVGTGDHWKFRIISRASDTPKTWGEMTDAEKGALLLARYKGEVIEAYWDKEWVKASGPHYFKFTNIYAYRIKPEPKRETVTLHGRKYVSKTHPEGLWDLDRNERRDGDTHRITFDLIDGEPDCSSVKMERIR